MRVTFVLDEAEIPTFQELGGQPTARPPGHGPGLYFEVLKLAFERLTESAGVDAEELKSLSREQALRRFSGPITSCGHCFFRMK